MNSVEYKLTQFSKGSGCGCKIAPAVLENILKNVRTQNSFPGLIAGNQGNEDAAVFELTKGKFLLSTTDFFTPIVDDPFLFGKISAANALSDIYAMGGRPLMALAILGFPVDKLPVEIASKIIDGAIEICTLAGIPLAGGHSIDTPEPVFGLSVNGFVTEQNLKRNNTSLKGDFLFLTKPIGSGIIASAHKKGKVSEAHLNGAIENMIRLNSIGEQMGEMPGVHAITDVTGFGFLGHLIEMCDGAGLSAEIEYESIPLMEGVQQYMNEFIFPDNVYRNWNAYEKFTEGVNGPEFIALNDPQTSGGLLITVAENSVADFIKFLLTQNLHLHIKPVGRMVSRKEKTIYVRT